MKNPIDIFKMDIKQLVKSPIAWLALIMLTVLPALFAWYDLSANKDPFQQTEHMKIGVVNEDKGTKIQGRKINVGKTVEQQLKTQKKWDWQFVDRQTAESALKKGNYVAVLHIPQTFSEDVTGIIRQKPKQTTVTYHVNEKINAITPKLTDATMGESIKQADAMFNASVMKVLLDEANKQGIQLEDQLPSYQKIRDSIALANEAMPKIEQFKQAVIELDRQQTDLEKNLTALQQVTQYKNEAMAANQQLNQIHNQNLAKYGPVLSGQAYDISVATGQFNQSLEPLFNQYDSVRTNLENHQPGARAQLSTLAQTLEKDFPSVQTDINKANQQFETLDKDNTLEHIVKLMRTDLKKQAGVASNPIHLERQSLFTVESFQSGLTPFITSTALWLGLLLTTLLIHARHPYETTIEARSSRFHFLGRIGLYTWITLFQASTIIITLFFILEIPIQSRLLFVGVSAFVALIYVFIVYTLVALFGNIGKIGVVLLLAFQFVGTDGVFPSAVAPSFVQKIQPFLPFHHSLMLFREAVGGVVYEALVTEMAWLGLFGIGVFISGLLLYPLLRRLRLKRIEKRGTSKLFE
ncbi:YhgE/Pip domain-containing protein [Staphylococcus ratti]|uniref:YhgE/Pip domain-containing protein n=1 Tax=Staphylococcus ratti TaxID=2892440 RepID=A0ABY3PDL0_9STAP|nr:YhgE/Pip domain-containing protein [Staphylococcus ratti]UEX90343.1 YhgE/Pip domain-containing protein [Staphylococcus ratti]